MGEEIKKCPKCGGLMERGSRLVAYAVVTFAKKGDIFGDEIIPYYCKSCGYIELYKKMK
ncbi:MAG: zinc ribbon domain-containing protein [Candidatus Bathyarchaeia archaeon]